MSHVNATKSNAVYQKNKTNEEQDTNTMSINNAEHTSVIFVSKTASIAYLDIQGANTRKFNLSDIITRQIFLPDHLNKNPHAIQVSNNLLRRIHIHKISIAPGSRNTFPFPLGIIIQGIPGSEYTVSGDVFNFIMPQNFSVQRDICIFESSGDASLMQTWEEDFAKWNTDNLETLCALCVPESEIVMVHLEHPVVQLLDKKSAEFDTTPPSDQPNTTPNWRQVLLYYTLNKSGYYKKLSLYIS
jgi:hypothetical protein